MDEQDDNARMIERFQSPEMRQSLYKDLSNAKGDDLRSMFETVDKLLRAPSPLKHTAVDELYALFGNTVLRNLYVTSSRLIMPSADACREVDQKKQVGQGFLPMEDLAPQKIDLSRFTDRETWDEKVAKRKEAIRQATEKMSGE